MITDLKFLSEFASQLNVLCMCIIQLALLHFTNHNQSMSLLSILTDRKLLLWHFKETQITLLWVYCIHVQRICTLHLQYSDIRFLVLQINPFLCSSFLSKLLTQLFCCLFCWRDLDSWSYIRTSISVRWRTYATNLFIITQV